MIHPFIKTALLVCALILSSAPSHASDHIVGNSGLAVVLIDMQKGFYTRGGTEGTRKLDALVLNQMSLLKWAQGNLIPVMVLQYESFGATDPRLMSILTKGRHRMIEKDNDNGFTGKSHDEVLRTLHQWNVDTLIVAGVNGPFCVQSTVMGALENNFDVLTTPYLIGNINQNPATFPNGSWTFKNHKLVVFPSLLSIIR